MMFMLTSTPGGIDWAITNTATGHRMAFRQDEGQLIADMLRAEFGSADDEEKW